MVAYRMCPFFFPFLYYMISLIAELKLVISDQSLYVPLIAAVISMVQITS
jgi:hypothetical protein